jgi:mono/diheme cytochrome c family protein
MRERIAIGITLLTLVLLVALSVGFAVNQNTAAARAPYAMTSPVEPAAEPAEPAAAEPPAAADPAPPADSVRGRAVYARLACARCHSVEGVGSRRYPLDGVGARRTRDELLAWTIGGEAVRDSLSPSALRTKQRYHEVPEAEMELLLRYLETLRTPP